MSEMIVELVAKTTNAQETCMAATAVCVNGKPNEKALRNAIRSGHGTVLEHAAFTFRVSGLSRVALAQLTRHRLASYDVQSQRYVDSSGNDYIVPGSVFGAGLDLDFIDAYYACLKCYDKMVEEGVPIEDARYILPQAVTTSLLFTMNARELLHFFSLRCCNRAQKEIRDMAWKMLKICQEEAPVLFEDAGPGCIRGHCPEVKSCGRPYEKE